MKALAMTGFFTVVLTLGSCTTTQPTVPRYSQLLADITGQNGRACVRVDDIESYGVFDGNVLSIDGGFKHYLATVLPGCMDLEASVAALFRSRFGEICGRSNDRVLTGGDQCTINTMYEFKNQDLALAAFDLAREQRRAVRESGL